MVFERRHQILLWFVAGIRKLQDHGLVSAGPLGLTDMGEKAEKMLEVIPTDAELGSICAFFLLKGYFKVEEDANACYTMMKHIRDGTFDQKLREFEEWRKNREKKES